MVMEAEWEKFGSTSSVSPRLDPNRSTESHIRAPNIDVQAVNDEIFVRENYPLESALLFLLQAGTKEVLCCCMSQVSSVFHRFL
ncbi:hypothetical protein V6N13_005119 [Hibiscus sabdariffa]|uniref:Uncharacterized protein n=1 Tax=Hibiscus sabdariffa TaxID=183260 RepID=A0ABR2C477_9ROSI